MIDNIEMADGNFLFQNNVTFMDEIVLAAGFS